MMKMKMNNIFEKQNSNYSFVYLFLYLSVLFSLHVVPHEDVAIGVFGCGVAGKLPGVREFGVVAGWLERVRSWELHFVPHLPFLLLSTNCNYCHDDT